MTDDIRKTKKNYFSKSGRSYIDELGRRFDALTNVRLDDRQFWHYEEVYEVDKDDAEFLISILKPKPYKRRG